MQNNFFHHYVKHYFYLICLLCDCRLKTMYSGDFTLYKVVEEEALTKSSNVLTITFHYSKNTTYT